MVAAVRTRRPLRARLERSVFQDPEGPVAVLAHGEGRPRRVELAALDRVVLVSRRRPPSSQFLRPAPARSKIGGKTRPERAIDPPLEQPAEGASAGERT